MLSAVNIPQSKSVSLAFCSLKSMILSILLTITLNQQSDSSTDQKCTSSLLSFASILQIFYLLGIIVDIFCLIYFYCSHSFKCMEYYVFYVYHIIVTLVTIIGALAAKGSVGGCDEGKTFLIGVVAVAVVGQVNFVLGMWTNLYFGLKYLHFGGNLVWFLMWISISSNCSSTLVGLIGMIHGALSLIGLASLLINKLQGKNSSTARSWRIFTCISLILMIFCFCMVILALLTQQKCAQSLFFQLLYERFGLIELISPILILIFLKGQSGDPREGIIKKHSQVFRKANQNEHINLAARV